MTNLFETATTQITLNPGVIILVAAAIAMLVYAIRQGSSAIVSQLSLSAASAFSIAATSAFAIVTSVQTIAAAPVA